MAEEGLNLHLVWLMKFLHTIVEIAKLWIFSLGGAGGRGADDDAKHGNHGKREQSCADDGQDKEDPFVILGLQQANTTIEEAIKARRKLALKWHPDRNIGNEEEATKKMQEINDAFQRVDRILTAQDDEEDDATQQPYNESDDEDISDAKRKQKEKRRRKQERKEQYDFEKKMRAEFENFHKAQRDANRGHFGCNFSPAAAAAAASTRNNGNRKISKSAKKKMRKAKGNNAQSSPENEDNANATEVPFHCMTIEKRCEVKFHSKDLLRKPLFTGKLRLHALSM